MTEPKRPAIYARVSTTDQDCEMQLRELRDFLHRQKWPQAIEFVDRISGTKAKRPALDQLMEAAAQGQIDSVLVWKIDRFGRSVLNLSQHLAALDAVKVRFIATSQGLDTDRSNPASRLLLLILAAIAEFERELILERSAMGRNKKLEAGKPDSWNLGYGLTVEGGEPRIVEKEAEVMNQIFRWRREGKSSYAIAGLLQSAGIKPRKAAFWSPATIRGMLQNTMYVGEYQRCGHIWAVPAIVPRELFDDVQREMRAVYERLVGRPSSKFLLRGMLFCRCSRRMHGSTCHTGSGGKWKHYQCDGKHHRNPSLPAPCDASRLGADVTDERVWKEIWKLFSDPLQLRQLAEDLAAEERAKIPVRRDPARELEAARAELKRIQRMVQKGTYDEDEGAAEATKLRRQIANLEAEIRALGKVIEIAPADAVERACRALASGPEPEGYEARRLVLEGLLDFRVSVDVDGKGVTITGKLPAPAAPLEKNWKDRLGAIGDELGFGHILKSPSRGK
jgi:site-specific DNA recombinase